MTWYVLYKMFRIVENHQKLIEINAESPVTFLHIPLRSSPQGAAGVVAVPAGEDGRTGQSSCESARSAAEWSRGGRDGRAPEAAPAAAGGAFWVMGGGPARVGESVETVTIRGECGGVRSPLSRWMASSMARPLRAASAASLIGVGMGDGLRDRRPPERPALRL